MKPEAFGNFDAGATIAMHAMIPATMQECEDALYDRIQAIPKRKGGPQRIHPTTAQAKVIAEFMDTGRPQCLIAEELGVCRDTLRRWIRDIKEGKIIVNK